MDRRQSTRYPFRMKASVHSIGSEPLPEAVQTWTSDLSARGVFLEFNEPPQPGTRLDITVDFPEEVIGRKVTLKCVARVMRVVRDDNRVGVGSLIERYEFVPAERQATKKS